LKRRQTPSKSHRNAIDFFLHDWLDTVASTQREVLKCCK
jgi:hypothetical protein